MNQLFDNWVDPYEAWFATPLGQVIKQVELELLLAHLAPKQGEQILDVGCGTGIFSAPLVEAGASLTGLDISLPMLQGARQRLASEQFCAADMLSLLFADNQFDKCVSVTALEFVADGKQALAELLRVTRPGGLVVVTTLNSLSPWAQRRLAKAAKDPHSLFNLSYFRSPSELLELTEVPGISASAVHFEKHSQVEEALAIERQGRLEASESGAFLLGCWQVPDS